MCRKSVLDLSYSDLDKIDMVISSWQRTSNTGSRTRFSSCSPTRPTRIIFVRPNQNMPSLNSKFRVENQDQFPALNEAQTIKLKHLTIVSMAAESRVSDATLSVDSFFSHSSCMQILSYPLLMSSLAMQTIRDLEDLIIDAIYLDILRGKLDQKEAQFEVEYTMGRDLEPGKLEAMLDALKNWSVYRHHNVSTSYSIPVFLFFYRASTTSSVLATLDAQIISISNQTAASKAHKEEHDAHVQFIIKEVNDKKDSNSGYSNSSSSHYAYPSPGHSGHGGSSRSRPIVLSGADQNAMDVDPSTQQESFLGGLISGSKGKNRK